ncbi:MAG: polysaccharide pyruvyl transferase family protein [Rhizobacter sp.]
MHTPGSADLSAHASTMRNLSAALDRIGDLIPPGSEIAYLDYPVHFNVGDQLINLGAEAFFARMRYRVSVRLSLFDLCQIDWAVPHRSTLKETARRKLAELDPAAVIVLHGGGNFGDIYPEFQVMRERVIAAFPERRIVVLPQSLHFSSPDQERASLTRLLAHPDLHVCVRDAESQAALRRCVPDAGILLPDMAHALWGMTDWAVPQFSSASTLVLSRTDAESTGLPTDVASASQFDWPDIVQRSDQFAFRAIRKAMAVNLDGSYRVPVAAWYRLRDRLVRRAVRLFSAHGQIVTDRLHGMILSALLARPVQYADNSYGKLSRYASAWLDPSPMIKRLGADVAAVATEEATAC